MFKYKQNLESDKIILSSTVLHILKLFLKFHYLYIWLFKDNQRTIEFNINDYSGRKKKIHLNTNEGIQIWKTYGICIAVNVIVLKNEQSILK